MQLFRSKEKPKTVLKWLQFTLFSQLKMSALMPCSCFAYYRFPAVITEEGFSDNLKGLQSAVYSQL